MGLTKLLGSKATRSLTVLSVLSEAKRAFSRGKRIRAVFLLGLAVVAWKWTMLGVAAQGVLKLVRGR
ncbi:hypothetical protein [Natronorubrum sulfidifaciens]|uniref:Uncharacterized protein n=1 Tax=Natronorubrum sulfidifaciens JCM 14089 TaxID=1230460 RepID=L9WAH7_9EURY|nr:hypothetical protein [Natronorubrum sulfidifaciens]ELY46281.1 hypothetical protein C495_06903 [Natronorubrum sulfidifaciens JCM 14089]